MYVFVCESMYVQIYECICVFMWMFVYIYISGYEFCMFYVNFSMTEYEFYWFKYVHSTYLILVGPLSHTGAKNFIHALSVGKLREYISG